MSIKELFEIIFGGIVKIFTAKNGVWIALGLIIIIGGIYKLFPAKKGIRNLIILIILILTPLTLNYVKERKECARFAEINEMDVRELDCEYAKELYGDEWEEELGYE